MYKQRFSLLLLEPSEIYFEDFSANLITETKKQPPTEDARPGLLKMCSKSLVFEEASLEKPLIKIHFSDCISISHWSGSLYIPETNVLAVECKQYSEIMANGQIAPYVQRIEKRTFLFNFHYVKVNDYLSQICQLHRATSLNIYDQNSMIAAIVYSRHNRIKFNPLWLEDIYEKNVMDCKVDEIEPLILNPGRLLLTNLFIYFQPYNNIQPYPVIKIRLTSIQSFTKRRFLLRQVGLEITWRDNDNKQHLLYVSFINETERNTFYNKTVEQPEYNVKEPEPEAITLKWQNGLISNFDYLLYLNSLADRTKRDLTQYPVFPWVISDYTSKELDLTDPKVYRELTKPIGALNPDRLSKLLERCEEMGEPKFLYGSHYSAPGLVLFYLVRQSPQLMLCLQNGRFDHPDRMFNDLSDVYKNCLVNMSDFKELIPEFYDTETNGDFLVNSLQINFGARHDGQAVNHVKLPPWAKNSPSSFVHILREALESDYTSENLHHWIDLIFGYKQRGKEAVKANNLFYYLCYEGAVDLDSITDPQKRHAYEVQISEFGQIPKQLFTKPHAARFSATPRLESEYLRRMSSVTQCRKSNESTRADTSAVVDVPEVSEFRMSGQMSAHKDDITCVRLFGDNNLVTTGKDGLLKCYNVVEKRQTRMVSVGDGSPLSSVVMIPGSSVLILGSWNNSIITYDLEFGKITGTTQAHDDAISCLTYLDDAGLLITGSWDCSVKIWRGFNADNSSVRISNSVIDHQLFDERVMNLDAFLSEDDDLYKIAVALSSGEIIIWKLVKSVLIARRTVRTSLDENGEWFNQSSWKVLTRHSQPAIDVKFNHNGDKLVSCGEDNITRILDIETAMVLFEKETKCPISCVNWALNDNVLIMGDRGGEIFLWNMLNGNFLCQIPAFRDGVSCLTSRLSSNLSEISIISGGREGANYSLKIWEQC